MTHPHLLHLRASSWSLNAARGALHVRAGEEAEQIAAEVAEGVNDGVRSSVFGQFGGTGHGDPVAAVALAGSLEPRPNRYQQLYASTTDTLRWLADQLGAPSCPGTPHRKHTNREAVCPDAPDPLVRLNRADMLPGTAATVTRWLAEADQRIRNLLHMAPQLAPLDALTSNPPVCPGCRMVTLYVQTAAPSHLWTVICRAECVCSGDGCRCGMPVRVEGVAHIWDRNAPFLT